MPPASAFLAEFTPLDGAFQLNLYSLIAIVVAVGGLLALFRRKPPLDTHLAKLETAIGALQEAVEALTAEQKKHAAHEQKISELETKVRHLETHRESDAATQRSYIAKNTREIFERIEGEARITQDKLDALSASTEARLRDLADTLAQNVQSLERGIGRIEGAFEVIRDRLNQSAS